MAATALRRLVDVELPAMRMDADALAVEINLYGAHAKLAATFAGPAL